MSKEGIGYFSFDTDFFHSDKKVKMIRSEFGAKGVVILIYTLCAIYSDKGYYMEWDEDDCFTMSDDVGCGCSPKLIGEVINRCVKREIFDEGIFNMFGVLTSHGIQLRFLKAASKREKIGIIKQYALFNLEELREGMRIKVTFLENAGARKHRKGASCGKKVASSPIKKESKESKENTIVHSEEMHGLEIAVKEEVQKPESLEDFYESIWKLYPIKKGKGQVSKTKKQVLRRIGYDEICRCIERFVLTMEVEKRDKKYWPHGSTFFNSGYVDYLDRNYLPEIECTVVEAEQDRFSCIDANIRTELESAGVIEGQSLNLGNASDEQAEFLKAAGVL